MHGMADGDDIDVYRPNGDPETPSVVYGVTAAVPVVVRLGAADPPPPYAPKGQGGTADVVVEPPSGCTLHRLKLRLISEDGASAERETSYGGPADLENAARFEVRAGRYHVTTATPFERVAMPPTEVVVKAGETTRVTVPVSPQPALRVEGFDGVAERYGAVLAIPGHETSVETELGALIGTFLPADVPAAVRWRGLVVPSGPRRRRARRADRRTAAPRDPVAVGLPSRSRVRPPRGAGHRGALLDRSAARRDDSQRPGDPASHALPSGHVRRPGGPPDRPRCKRPRRSGSCHPRVDRYAELTARRADGTVPAHVRSIVEANPPDEAIDFEDTKWPLAVRVPAHVTFIAEGLAPLVVDVTEPGERTASWGPAAMTFEITGADGAPLDAVVLLDESLHRADGGHLSLAGLADGPHRVVVAPRTTALRAVEATVKLTGCESRVLHVRLRAR